MISDEEDPYPDLGIILMSWKRQAKEEFSARINQHLMICQQSRAFRISSMDPEMVGLFETFMKTSGIGQYLIDISTATHSATSGRVYVQYLEAYKTQVQALILEYIRHGK